MSRQHKFELLIVSLASALVFALAFLVHPISPPRRNERNVVNLMKVLRPIVQGCCVSAVDLKNGVILRPGRPQKLTGYSFTLRSNEEGFSLEAVPEQPEVTGLRHYFLDQTGVIRAAYRKRATGDSPPIQGLAP